MVKKKLASMLLVTSIFGISAAPALIDVSAETSQSGHWVGAWSSSQLAAWHTVNWDGGISRKGFSNQTLRMVVHPNASGSAVRIRLSNEFGIKPLTFGKVTIADTKQGAEVVPGSMKALTFSQRESVTIPAGEEIFSDPIPFEIVEGNDLTVSVYIPENSGPATWHFTSNRLTYASTSGDFTDVNNESAFQNRYTSWFWLSGVDVLTNSNKKSRVIVALGDSITDGVFENRRWTDVLNERLDKEIKNQTFSVLNQGISGNRILSDSPIFGEKALDRLERDVFSQTGVTDLILLEGINDIGHIPHVHDADQIIGGIKEIAEEAHKRGIKVYAGTLTPFNAYDNGNYFTPEGEQTRQEVNKWIRSNSTLDGFIDFDRTLADPANPQKILPAYDSGDHLHPNDLGLKAMAESIDLSVFEKPLNRKAGARE